jgi:hypothetical protein
LTGALVINGAHERAQGADNMPTAATIAIAQDKVTDRLDKAMRKLAKRHDLEVAELPYERNADLARIAELERIADLLDGVIKAEKHEDDERDKEDAPAPATSDNGNAADAAAVNDSDDDAPATSDNGNEAQAETVEQAPPAPIVVEQQPPAPQRRGRGAR